MIFNIQPRPMIATKMKVEIIPPYTADTFNTYWEIITNNGKVIDRGNMAIPIQYMPIFVNVIKSIDANGDVIGDEIRMMLNAILSDPSIEIPLADLPVVPDNSGENLGGTQSGENSGENNPI